MVQRVISTLFKIDGEEEYKASVNNINRALKETESELKLVASNFVENANSMEALRAKSDILARQYELQQSKVETVRTAYEKAVKAQGEFANQSAELRQKIESVKDGMAKLSDGTKQSKAKTEEYKQELKSLNERLAETEENEQKAANSSTKYKIELNRAQTEVNKLNNEIQKNNKYLEEAKNSSDGCATSIDKFGKEIKETKEEAKEFGQVSSQAIDTLSAALAAAGVQKSLEEIRELLVDCTGAAREFENGMAEVFTLLPGQSQEVYDKMSDDMLKFSANMNVLTNVSVPALYSAVSAGVPKENVFAFLETAQKAAVGGVTSLETAVDGLTSVVNAYGETEINVAKAADQMFVAVKLGKTNFDQLSNSLFHCVPNAAAAGVEFGNVAAALAVMTAQGVPTAQATTQLRQMLVELTQTGSKADLAFREVAGRGFKDFIAEGNNVQDALKLMEQHAASNNLAINELFSSVEAGMATLLLTGTATEKFTSALKEMELSAGAADAAYEKMASTAEFADQKRQVATENLKTAIGNTILPAVKNLNEGIADMTNRITAFVEKNPWIVKAIMALAAAMSTVVVALTGFMIIPKIIPLIDALNLALAANPAGAVAVAITALAAGLATLAITSSDASEKVVEFNNTLGDAQKASQDAIASGEAEIRMLENKGKKYEELRTKVNRTKAEEILLKQVAEELSEAMGDGTKLIDEQTGSYLALADSLEIVIQKKRDQIKLDAMTALATEAQKTVYQAEKAQEEILSRVTEEQRERIINDIGRDGAIKTIPELVNRTYGTNTENLTKYKEAEDALKQAREILADYDALLEEIAGKESTTREGGKDQTAEKQSAVYDGLKNKYTTLMEQEKKAIQESIDNWKRWEEENTSAIQAQIDALDALEQKENDEKKAAELKQKIDEIEYKLRFETDAYNRQQMEKALASAKNDYNEELLSQERRNMRESLTQQMQNIKETSSAEQEKLKNNATTAEESYKKLLEESNLKQEASAMVGAMPNGLNPFFELYNKDYYDKIMKESSKSILEEATQAGTNTAEKLKDAAMSLQLAVLQKMGVPVSTAAKNAAEKTVNLNAYFYGDITDPAEINKRLNQFANKIADMLG